MDPRSYRRPALYRQGVAARRLGATDRSVFPVGLGCMGLSWGYRDPSVDERAGIALIHGAIDLGVDHFDTADVYGPFTNEKLVGRALAGRRDRIVLATKVGLVVEDAATYRYGRNGRPEHVRASCDASLSRLGVDVIDLYYLHRADPQTPVEETWAAMAGLVAAGKVRWLGISEPSVAELDRVSAIHPVTAVQSEMSLWTRDHLEDVVPWCAAHGAAFVAFSPLGRGFLTGAIGSGARFGPEDFRSKLPRFRPEAVAENQGLVGPGPRASPNAAERRPPRSRSPGCCRGASTSSRSRDAAPTLSRAEHRRRGGRPLPR